MITVVGLALAALAGVSWPRLLVLAAVVYQPLLVTAVVAVLIWRGRPRSDTRPALFCEGVAAELRAGSALRDAVVTTARATGCTTPISSEATTNEIASVLGDEYPDIADVLEATLVSSTHAGSDPAMLFDEIGSLALARNEIASEVRMATAPGIATALVLVGAPMIFVLFQAQSGSLARSLVSGGQRVAALLGLAVFLVGALLAGLVVWRSRS